MAESAPVITLDGPGGAGKGTLALALAQRLGWQVLDSGALYRAMGLIGARAGWSPDVAADRTAAADAAAQLAVSFEITPDGIRVSREGEDITETIRSSEVAEQASQWAAVPAVRDALLARQRAFAQPPGLIGDGRDMGTVIFPDAACKFYITASAEQRARRRLAQLSMPKTTDKIGKLYNEIETRDARDREREASPLKPAADAVVIDTSDDDPSSSLERLLAEVSRQGIA
ncbi:(d)CMP kinase [Salinisphaera sp. USBA-960]|nr:(d)CMP kinase [Salifodinibacter halophilus]NNC26386.1 (d)CMP kinase [Salifodinibacter halophilus]